MTPRNPARANSSRSPSRLIRSRQLDVITMEAPVRSTISLSRAMPVEANGASESKGASTPSTSRKTIRSRRTDLRKR